MSPTSDKYVLKGPQRSNAPGYLAALDDLADRHILVLE
jgi:hypothetical protein